MKLLFQILLTWSLVAGCSSDDDHNRANPYLPNVLVNLQLDLNLPQYETLKFPGNHVVLHGQGVRGIVIYAQGGDIFHAHELSDPNHPPGDCSLMEVEGITASCPCPDDDHSYDIITGQHTTQPDNSYPMLRYRAQLQGNVLTLTN